MHAEQRVLCLAARPHATDETLARLSVALANPIDWEYLWAEACRHEVWPLVDLNVRKLVDQAAIPPAWLTRSQQHCYATLLENALLASELMSVIAALRDAGVKVIPVKGIVLAESSYGSLALRPAADIDILVHAGDILAARKVLQTVGFQPKADPDFGHVAHPTHGPPYMRDVAGRTVLVELHWTLWAPHLFPLPIDRFWKRATTIQIRGTSTLTLSPEDTLLHLVIHNARAPLLLRRVADVAALLQRHRQTLDWDYIFETARHGGARMALYSSLMLAYELLDAPLPPDIVSRIGLSGVKRYLATRVYGKQALFRPDIREQRDYVSPLRRLLMFDNSLQAINAMSYRFTKAGRHVRYVLEQD